MFYVRGFHSETNTGPCVFALCYFYKMLFFIFDLLSSTPFTAPGIPVSEEAAETMWCAVNAVSTCRTKFNFFNYLVIFRHYLTGNGKVSCILATISDWFPNINRASDISQKKKSNFTGFLGTKLRKNRSISREFSGQTWPESNRWKNGGICGYFQGKFRNKSIGFALIRLAFLMFF